MPTITLKPGREKSLLRRHPWIFSGAIARLDGQPALGETVSVLSSAGLPLGQGAYSPQSQIAVRLWTFDEQAIDEAFFRARLQQALSLRLGPLAEPNVTAMRLVNAESDGLPGVVVDRYGPFLVCQFLSAGAERWKHEIVSLLQQLLAPAGVEVQGIYERSDVDVRHKEGLAPASGVLAGQAPPETVVVDEYGCQFAVQISRGHKTGFYLDQRENRVLLSQYSRGRTVLNGFAYTGAFAVWALKGGALHVTNVEASAPALDLARENMRLNGLAQEQADQVEGDMFEVLRRYRDSRTTFDLIILDPPKFAESRSHLDRATRGYKDINLLAFKLLRPGGVLFTFSCSGLVTPELFQMVVAGAALDSGRSVQILHRLGQAPDHPVALNFPEGEYLKGLVCRVSD
ncbi:MAG: class I SAM-dependent methyltransferase [Anaerolineales bacterium]